MNTNMFKYANNYAATQLKYSTTMKRMTRQNIAWQRKMIQQVIQV